MALAIFIITYALLTGVKLPGVKLDRPGAAFVGAVAMVVTRVVAPGDVAHAIDIDTLALLLGMMVLAAALTQASFFRACASLTLRWAKTPRGLLAGLIFTSAALSAFLVNDTVCLMLTPLVLAVTEAAELPAEPYLLGLCMSSNAGSVATFTGNPQNMIIGVASHLSFGRFAAFMVLPALVATVTVWAVLAWVYRGEVTRRPLAAHAAPPPVDRPLLALCVAVLLAVTTAFFLGASMAWSAMGGAAAVLVLSRRESRLFLKQVDHELLLLFASLFLLVFGVNQEGWAERMRLEFAPIMQGTLARETFGFTALSVVASNVFSNVPYVMLAKAWVPSMQRPALGWEVLALSSTLAGNLTLLGSVANVIVFEQARDRAPMGFVRYLRVGVPVTLVSLILGLLVLLAEHEVFDRFLNG